MLKDKDLKELINHYNSYLGDLEEIEYQPNAKMPFKPRLILSHANEHRPYNVVATVGLSGVKLSGIYKNCEFLMLLDENWKFKMDNINHTWPLELINKISNAIYLSKAEIGYGQYFINDNNKPFCPLTDMGVALIAVPAMLDKKFFELKSGRKTVNFFVLTTATFDELKIIKHIGGINFIQRYLIPEGENAFITRNKKL